MLGEICGPQGALHFIRPCGIELRQDVILSAALN